MSNLLTIIINGIKKKISLLTFSGGPKEYVVYKDNIEKKYKK